MMDRVAVLINRPAARHGHVLIGHGRHFAGPAGEGIAFQRGYRSGRDGRAVFVGRLSGNSGCAFRHFARVAVAHLMTVDLPAARHGNVLVTHGKVRRGLAVDLPAAEGVAGQCRSISDCYLFTGLVILRSRNRWGVRRNGTRIGIGNIQFGNFFKVREINSVSEESVGRRRIVPRHGHNMRVPCRRVILQHMFHTASLHCPVGELILGCIVLLSFCNSSGENRIHVSHNIEPAVSGSVVREMTSRRRVVFILDHVLDMYLLLGELSFDFENVTVIHAILRNLNRVVLGVALPTVKCIAGHTRLIRQRYGVSRMRGYVRRQRISLRFSRVGGQSIPDNHCNSALRTGIVQDNRIVRDSVRIH